MRDHLLPVWQEKYPDIQVELELHTSTADQLSKVMLTMATDVAPDVIDTAGTLLFSYVVNNGVVDVAPYLERDGLTDEWFPHTLDEVRYPFETGTGLYGLPYDWVGGVLVYNTDLFDQTGMVYPDPTWTWEDVRIAARRLTQDTDGDGVPDVWGFHVQELGNVPFDPVVRAHGGSILTPDRKAAAINSPAAAQVLELFYGMVNEDRSTGFRQGANLFALGRVAMEVVGSWTIRNVDNQGTNYGVTTVPAGPAGRSAYGGSNVWAVIKRPGQDMEAVWTIVKELVSYDTLRLISNEYGLPARRADSRLGADQGEPGPDGVDTVHVPRRVDARLEHLANRQARGTRSRRPRRPADSGGSGAGRSRHQPRPGRGVSAVTRRGA